MISEKEIIYIGQPYITTEDEKAKLCADITENKITRTLYYEVDKKYKEYLCYERSDAFVVGLIHHAMNVGKNIVCKGVVTEQLLFQMRNFYIPVISENMPDLQFITIEAEPTSKDLPTMKAVGTGNSGGIDSFYTILRYMKESNSYKLTHLVFNNISTEDDDENRIRQLFERDKIEKENVAKELGLEAVSMYSNLYSFYASHFIFNYYYAAQYTSAPYALAKLFSEYYYSSSYSIADFTVNHNKMSDGSNFDIFALSCLSTRNINFYSTGGDVGRIEKTLYVSDNETVQRHLQVCAVEQNKDYYGKDGKQLNKLNCGKCKKCKRTITTLYGLGVLDKYSETFDLSFFEANKAKFIGYQLAADLHEFTSEIRQMLKGNGVMPRYTKLWEFLWRIRFSLSKVKVLRDIYHKIKK